MKHFRLLILSAALCSAAVFTGCVDTADNELSAREKEWERVLRRSYPGYRIPKTTAPAQRDGVVRYEEPMAVSDKAAVAPVASADPVAVEDPVAAVDKAASANPAAEIKEPEIPVPAAAAGKDVKAEAPAKQEVKAEAKAAAAADKPAKNAKAVKGETANITVKAGDTIGGIAKEFYGNVKYADVILKANPHVKDPKRLSIGTKLVIPAL